MKTILAGFVALAGLFVVFADPSDAANKKRYRSADSYSERYPYATPRQRQNARAYERGGEYYEQDSNAHPVGSRSWWELKEREGWGYDR